MAVAAVAEMAVVEMAVVEMAVVDVVIVIDRSNSGIEQQYSLKFFQTQAMIGLETQQMPHPGHQQR
jgi:hypothetical protein